jgi:Xaa-Pro aminopeptidase
MKRITAIFSLIVFSLSAFPFNAAAETPDSRDPYAVRITPPAPRITDAERQTELARRRKAVADRMEDGSMLILLSAEPKQYAGDVDFMYRQENNLYYLTALKQNGATFVMTKTNGSVQEFLFLPKRNPQYETWNGRMYSNEDATRLSGIKTIINAAEKNKFLEAVKSKTAFTSENKVSIPSAEILYLLLPEHPGDNDGRREYRQEVEFSKTLSGYRVENAVPIFSELRLVKSPYELKILQHAIDISIEAHGRAMATVNRVKYEYETQAEVEYVFRRRNADYWGYPSIVGCGPNATTLHYVESQGAVKPGDLLLMDVGAEYDHYTADITRTFPVSGKFTKEQREIYQIVFDAQEAAASKIKPGAMFSEPSQAAAKTIEAGLAKLGLIESVGAFIPGTEREVPDGKGGKRKVGIPQYSLWYMHGWGHWLGMNVHDVGDYSTVLKPGMVMTNEPGIYIREDALDYFPDTPETRAFIAKIRPAFEKYKNIGVRIEDDMLVTETGVEWMSRNLPRKLEDVEAFIAKASSSVNLAAERRTEKPVFSVFDFSTNSFANLASFFETGRNGRTGFIGAGKTAAYAGALHNGHAHAE